MSKAHNPSSIAPPFGRYSHGIEVGPNARWLVAAGQVGVAPDGTTPEDPIEQNRLAWANLTAILEEAGMSRNDIVRINAYVTSTEGVAAFRDVRNEMVGDPPPASTLLVVQALAAPTWGVEIEVIAAKED